MNILYQMDSNTAQIRVSSFYSVVLPNSKSVYRAMFQNLHLLMTPFGQHLNFAVTGSEQILLFH